MVSLYKHHMPSTTSLSDDAEDNDEEAPPFAFNPDHLQPVTAQWASKRSHSELVQLANRSPISTVPPEILIQILKHVHSPRDLFAILRVSRTFCECAVELLWHKPSFPKYDTIHKMASLLRTERQTFTYPRFIRRLNFLNHGSDLSDILFREFVRCDRLERLTLIGCKDLSASVLSEVLPAFSNLVAIDLSNVVNTTSEAVIGLAFVASRLQGINLTSCEQVTDAGIIALATNCPLLRRVKLSGLSLLSDYSISALAEGCPMLLEMDLHNCNLITDVSVRLIWSNLTHMREMRLSHCSLLTDAAFPAPFGPDYHLDCVNPFTTSAFKKENEEFPPLIVNRMFENLRMLDLTACLLTTDLAVEGIISHAPKIRNLVLSKCALLTDRAVEIICRLGRHLHYLHLGHASKITDRSVRLLARSCTRIRYVDFANCILLTDMSVFELSALPKLRRIGLVRVSQLTDEAIYALAERHATLERIHLSYCDQISVMAIHFLLLKLHKLTHLSLTGVPAFRQPELQRFCREAPKDFNTAQRLAFCVFSGKGVSQLRTYLTELFDSMTEMNNTDDTEYEEDDFDGEGYQEDDTPEPETVVEIQTEGYPRQQMLYNPNVTTTAGVPNTAQPYQGQQQFHPPPPVDLQQNLARGPVIYMPAHYRTTPDRAPSANLAEASMRLSAHQASGMSTGGPSRVPRLPPAVQRPGRSVADALPIVESSASPSPIDTPGRVSAAASDNGAGFFRTYNDRPTATLSPRGDGTLTPDLNFAEIGHGRGTQSTGASTTRGHVLNRTPRQQPLARPMHEAAPSRRHSSEYVINEVATDSTRGGLHRTERVGWTYIEPVLPNPLNRELHDYVQMAFDSELRGRPEQVEGNTGHSGQRSRSVRRQIKNTFHAAEHYASSLFHRSSGNVNDGGGSGGADTGTSHPSGSSGSNRTPRSR